MATRKLPRTTRTLTEDFAGSPWRVAYDRVERSYVVVSADDVEGMHHGYTGGDPAGYARAYEFAAALNIEASAQLADEQAQRDAEAEQERANTVATQHVAALDAWRAAEGLARHLLGELAENRLQAMLALMNGERFAGESDSLDAAYDRKRQQLAGLGFEVTAAAGGPLELVRLDPDAELNAREDALARRCGCFRGALLNGDNERPACVEAGRCLDEAEDAARALAEDDAYGAYVDAHGHDPAKWTSSWRVTQEQMREIARDLGLLVPELPLHPDPAMDVATFAAVWDARSESLGHVARALRGEGGASASATE